MSGAAPDPQPKTDQTAPSLTPVVFGFLIAFILLVVAGLVYKNWTLRKELAKSERDRLHPAIYEEIEYNKYATQK
ncbi:deleted in malignant brain tumors 1 protein-like, partial [Arapaima gigas]